MAQPMVTRSQRRVERKQLVLIVVLILAVAAASFSLGVMYGRRSGVRTMVAADAERPQPAAVTQIAPPPLPAAGDAQEAPARLTFYDNLPKGNQAPLGSGINLPPEEKKVIAAAPKESQATTPAPVAPPPTVTAPPPKTATVAAPPSVTGGAFLVQVASFRSREDADKMAARLAAYRMSAQIEKADLGAKGVWFRVLAGPYASRESAEQAAGLLRDKERVSALVRQK